jgi:hypothetical protein
MIMSDELRPVTYSLGSRPLGTRARGGADNPLNKLAFSVGRSGNSANS